MWTVTDEQWFRLQRLHGALKAVSALANPEVGADQVTLRRDDAAHLFEVFADYLSDTMMPPAPAPPRRPPA